MGIVNDSLPAEAIGEEQHAPCRDARFRLGYPAQLNVAHELLDRNLAVGRASRPAIRYKGQVWTYGALAERVNRVANALVHQGVRPGGRVLLHLPNRPELVESWLAALRIGAVVVTTAPMLRQREMHQIVAETEPTCLITASDLLAVFAGCDALPGTQVVVGGDSQGKLAYEEWLAAGSSDCAAAPTTEDDVALVAYTSGSSGRQKGTIHTHSDVLAIADTYARSILAPMEDDCLAGHSPMAFTYGLGGLLVFPMRFGASVVLESAPFDPGRWLNAIRGERVTLLFATPTAGRLYLEERTCRERTTWDSVRVVVSAGEPLTRATFERWREETGTAILDGCGSTEMLHIWISQRLDEAIGGCTGRPVPLYQARLVDDKGNEVLSQEAEGVVALKGPTGCRYWRQPKLQANTVVDGWTLTGDRFRRDAEGRYWFVSRTDDMIVSGGYKIPPAEVQEILLGCPEIREAVVVGIPDEMRGQVVRACVVLRPGFIAGDALTLRVKKRIREAIAPFKCPKEIVFLNEFPRISSGKVDRRALGKLEARPGDARSAGADSPMPVSTANHAARR